ncbi:putative fungal-specific transcription factor [Xylogone sp. PMI_703]|nr:putative fungal-specific transcription factor [Xylogone sp. PMI_703]
MVRTTIACSWCRRSKVKCVHEGEPPCRNCFKAGGTRVQNCVLSGPFDTPVGIGRQLRAKKYNPRHSDYSQRSASPRGGTNAVRQLIPISPRQCGIATAANDIELRVRHHAQGQDQDLILSLPPSVIKNAVLLFSQKFPELAFFHFPSFCQDIATREEPRFRVLVSSILALDGRVVPDNTPRLRSCEEYAAYCRENLPGLVLDSPSIPVIQALLIISMYEWGNRDGYKAWMYTGMAIRMVQSHQILKKDQPLSGIEHEVLNRTFWACYVMDRIVFCGKSQPLTLPLERMSVHLPVSDPDFAFGCFASPHYTINDLEQDTRAAEIHGDMDHCYSILVRGLDVCHKILEWVVNGGRKQSGMTRPENCPWSSNSTWSLLNRYLNTWRSQQSQRLHYPHNPIGVHISMGRGESVAYINLIYYVCVLFLNREYIPFLPTAESEPRGPVDPPLLEASAPNSWWKDRAWDLFHAAETITDLLQELGELDRSLLTPFTGFCAFSAAAINVYVEAFPRMNLGRSIRASALVELNVAYFDKFCRSWKIGNGWWKTITYMKILFRRANRDRVNFQRKTRADFVELEASIHDYTGKSPPPDSIPQDTEAIAINDSNNRGIRTNTANSEECATPRITMQNIHPHIQASTENILNDNSQSYGLWNELWPVSSLWGENQFSPFTDGDIAVDFSSETLYQ